MRECGDDESCVNLLGPVVVVDCCGVWWEVCVADKCVWRTSVYCVVSTIVDRCVVHWTCCFCEPVYLALDVGKVLFSWRVVGGGLDTMRVPPAGPLDGLPSLVWRLSVLC